MGCATHGHLISSELYMALRLVSSWRARATFTVSLHGKPRQSECVRNMAYT